MLYIVYASGERGPFPSVQMLPHLRPHGPVPGATPLRAQSLCRLLSALQKHVCRTRQRTLSPESIGLLDQAFLTCACVWQPGWVNVEPEDFDRPELRGQPVAAFKWITSCRASGAVLDASHRDTDML